MNFKQKSFYGVIGLLFVGGIFLLGASYGSLLFPSQTKINPPPASEAVRAVTLLIDDGDKITSYKTVVPLAEMSVFALLNFVSQEYKIKLDYDPSDASVYGVFIKQIGEKVNGAENKYWQYWVNGSQPMVAADKYILQGGEIVLWTFRKSQL